MPVSFCWAVRNLGASTLRVSALTCTSSTDWSMSASAGSIARCVAARSNNLVATSSFVGTAFRLFAGAR